LREGEGLGILILGEPTLEKILRVVKKEEFQKAEAEWHLPSKKTRMNYVDSEGGGGLQELAADSVEEETWGSGNSHLAVQKKPRRRGLPKKGKGRNSRVLAGNRQSMIDRGLGGGEAVVPEKSGRKHREWEPCTLCAKKNKKSKKNPSSKGKNLTLESGSQRKKDLIRAVSRRRKAEVAGRKCLRTGQKKRLFPEGGEGLA